eukprot:g3012.t1
MQLSTYSSKGASRGILESSTVRNRRKLIPISVHKKRLNGVIHCQSNDPDHGTGGGQIPDKIPSISLGSDWRTFRAQLVAESNSLERETWAHALPTPELGCLLLAHPLMFNQQQTYFNLAVIFIFVHGEEGSAGLILNKPTRYKLSDFSLSRDIAEGFEDNTLFLGGDVGDTSLHLVHGFSDLEKSIKVLDGVYINGFEAAKKAVLNGTKKPSDFNWYTRYCGWNRGQLEEECKSGVWFPAASSANLIVKERCFVESSADDWHQIMQLMGGEHKQLSNAVLASYAAEVKKSNLADDDLE